MQLYQPTITGSLSISGSIVLEGPITVISGSVSGTASLAVTSSYSQNSERLDNLDSTSFVFTSSYNVDSSSFSGRVTTIESKYATTGSNIFTSNQTICGNLTTTGTITAQTINVQQVTSSVVYSSGSNIFGNQLSNTQQFTGSMFITGSTLNVNGGSVCALNFYTSNGTSTASIIRQTDPNSYSSLRLYNDQNSATRALEIDYFGSTHPSGERGEIFNTGAYPLLLGTSNTARLTIAANGIACFTCQVCSPYFVGSSGVISCANIVANGGTITATTSTVGNQAAFVANAPDNTSDIGLRVQTGGTLKWFIGMPNNIVNDNFTIFDGNCSTDRLTINTSGNIGINTCTPGSLLSIQRGASGDNMELIGSGASGYSDILFYNTNKVARLGYIDWSDTQSRLNVEANIPLILYTNATARMCITNTGLTIFCCSVGIGTATIANSSNYNMLRINGTTGGEISIAGGGTEYGYMYANSGNFVVATQANIPLIIQTNTINRIRIAGTGDVAFCCRIGIGAASPIARIHTCTGYNANNLQAIFGNSNGSINCMTYDTVVIQQDDVTTLKLVERNIGSIDQVLGISIGDGFARFSTTCTQPIQFFVNGNPSGCSYNGLSGILALELASSGISTFSCGLCANRLTLAGAVNLCGAIENTGTGTGVYTRSTWYADTVNSILFENGRTTDSASGTGRTVYFTWRGGPSTGGGVQLQHGTNAWAAYTSDCKMKTKVADVENGLAAVMKLNPIKFKWTNELETSRTVTGFTAQNVEEAIPDAVFNSWTHCELGEIKSYYQDYLVPYLVKAIQELKCENDIFKSCLGLT